MFRSGEGKPYLHNSKELFEQKHNLENIRNAVKATSRLIAYPAIVTAFTGDA